MRPPPTAPARFDVVALATSAGGLEALGTVLGALPADFPAAVLVIQHLGRYGSALVELLRERCALPVAWVADGVHLTPGRVLVCPPQRAVDVHADGTCTVRPGVRRAPDRPIDALFRTLAAGVGARVIGVVLTGMADDGAEGVGALHRAGATVLAQSEDSARYPAMPRAAAATGVVDLVLALDEIGPTLARVAAGGPLPRSRAEVAARTALFTGHGAARVGPLLADVDWSATPLGPVAGWPPALCTAVRIALSSHVAMSVYWGPAFVWLCNDAVLAMRDHGCPAAGLGRSARESVAWPVVGASLEHVVRTGDAELAEDHALARAVTFSRIPILDSSAPTGVGGVLVVATEAVALGAAGAPGGAGRT